MLSSDGVAGGEGIEGIGDDRSDGLGDPAAARLVCSEPRGAASFAGLSTDKPLDCSGADAVGSPRLLARLLLCVPKLRGTVLA
eukprot:CAMPEP_0168475024 /NCGR_PEP_ID=MMETSP0228-20121227/61148_1 /TAXON_ID=133427 /ORGANISM="Protoceratium reticulatum, Strain CCCM 535 (=CCMP 1889)" /LENGTH=82 /DNA_ID=CAMNT_0008491079 /DNA_START=18 /DNA_END=262 /DNA_ORIENTATION=+